MHVTQRCSKNYSTLLKVSEPNLQFFQFSVSNWKDIVHGAPAINLLFNFQFKTLLELCRNFTGNRSPSTSVAKW